MINHEKSWVLLITILACGDLFANPVLSSHVAPTGATIDQSNPQKTIVNQSAPHAIINWHSFNIGNNEETHFEQPIGGIAVNRINPKQGVSEIYGHLSATGQVILINQAGIHFGPGSKVDVGSIIAKSHHSIINEGTINAKDYGLVALLSPTVANHGVINAKLGTIVLASGNKFTLDFYGDELINFAIDKEFTEGKGVENTGALYADGGRILVTAKAAQDIVDNVINMQGIAQANSVGEYNGEIVIYGGEHGITKVDAELNASSGNVHIDGNVIKVNHSKINVSGDPAGEILIGGDEKGKHIQLFKKELPNASQTIIYPGSEFIAEGITGKIVVWSDHKDKQSKTWILGSGAEKSMFRVPHGLLELSGANHLFIGDVPYLIDLTKISIKTKLLRLDPFNVTVSNAPTSGTVSISGFDPTVFSPTASGDNVSIADIVSILGASASVEITTGTSGTEAGNITVLNPISWTDSGDFLRLVAANNIYINAPISSPDGVLELQAGNLIFGKANTANIIVDLISGTFATATTALNALAVSAIYSGLPVLPSTDLVYAKRFYPYDVASDVYGMAQTENAMDPAYNDVGIATGGACGGVAY